MARTGVTQDQINAAADALLLAGERPTVERIRIALGSGSPNTVGRLLDTWWVELGQRLAAKQHQVAVADAPEEVSDLASGLWRTALSTAQQVVEKDISTSRQQLAEATASLEAERQTLLDAQAASKAEEIRLQSELDRALVRIEELQQQLRVMETQKTRVEAQADEAVQARDAITQRLDAAQHAAAVAAERAAQERASLIAHSQAVEERAAQDIDRLRQELKAARQDAQADKKEFRAQLAVLEAALHTAQKDEQAARKAEAAATSRADVLAVQLSSLPDALQSALTAASARSKVPRRKQVKSAKSAQNKIGVKA